MSNTPQQFIDALKTRLQERLGESGYRIEAREPFEGELAADAQTKQIFITTEGMQVAGAVADSGIGTQVVMPVMVACVMQRPGTEGLARGVLRRRQTIMQAIQSVVADFADVRQDVLVEIQNEQLLLIEGFHLSIIGTDLYYDLDSEDNL